MDENIQPKKQPDFEMCPLVQVIELLGGKWRLPVLCTLFGHEHLRYGEIKYRVCGITNIMLTKILKDFESAGIVIRKQYNEVPPHTEYSLSETGRSFMSALHTLSAWQVQRSSGGFSEECEACHRI